MSIDISDNIPYTSDTEDYADYPHRRTNPGFFPPRQHADFVIHYDDKAFHVHKFVLHHHSAYFRAYFKTLTQSLDSSIPPPTKKRRSCHHPSIAHCIHLPQQMYLVEEEGIVDAADFDLFLCHLYFSDRYCYPP